METLPKYLSRKNGQLWLIEDEGNHLEVSYRIKEVIYARNSRFQHVMILDSFDFGRMLVLDGIIQTTARDGFIYNEMITHVPLHLHPKPRRVLIIGGGDLGAAREVAKYETVEQIDLVEIDELVIKVCREHLQEVSGNLSDPRLNLILEDGAEFIKNVTRRYDVIIIDSSDPVGPAKQLFEANFYQNVHRALEEDGIMVCQSESPVFHLHVLKQIYRNISCLFPVTRVYTAVVPTYPGGLWSFTLGSKKYDLEAAGKPFTKDTRYVNGDILKHCFHLPELIKKELEVKE